MKHRRLIQLGCVASLCLVIGMTVGAGGDGPGDVPDGQRPASLEHTSNAAPLETDSPAPGSPKLSAAEVRDLEAIRRKMGGGLVKDPVWNAGSVTGDGFGRSLRDEFGAPVEPTHDDVPSIIFRQRSLHSLGRRLDAIAQDMDELRLFDQADQLREISRGLREEVRHAVPPPSATDAGESALLGMTRWWVPGEPP